jgi:hypothetical protein
VQEAIQSAGGARLATRGATAAWLRQMIESESPYLPDRFEAPRIPHQVRGSAREAKLAPRHLTLAGAQLAQQVHTPRTAMRNQRTQLARADGCGVVHSRVASPPQKTRAFS